MSVQGKSILRQLVLIGFLSASSTTAFADEFLQFGVIFPTDFRAGTTLPPGQGFGFQTFVVGNLGTTAFSFSDLSFTSSILSTTTPVNPLVDVRIRDPGIHLAPGEALGNINGDFNQPLTLTYVRSIFPTITTLTLDPNNGLLATFDNPLGSGVVFQDTQTTVAYQLDIKGATAGWTTTYEIGIPDLEIGFTEGTLGNAVSNVVVIPAPVPEPATWLLLGSGLVALALAKSKLVV